MSERGQLIHRPEGGSRARLTAPTPGATRIRPAEATRPMSSRLCDTKAPRCRARCITAPQTLRAPGPPQLSAKTRRVGGRHPRADPTPLGRAGTSGASRFPDCLRRPRRGSRSRPPSLERRRAASVACPPPARPGRGAPSSARQSCHKTRKFKPIVRHMFRSAAWNVRQAAPCRAEGDRVTIAHN